MIHCRTCGRANPEGAIVCGYCGVRFPSPHQQNIYSSNCRVCRKRLPFGSTQRSRGTCDACHDRIDREIRIATAKEAERRRVFVRDVAARYPELRQKILPILGVGDLQKDFSVSDHNYRLIGDWSSVVLKARNFESARRYEDAAKCYEELDLWKEAGQARDKKTARTVKHVTVNLNDLIEKVRDGDLTIPYKCHSCGATITIDSHSDPNGLKFCSYCGSAVDPDSMLDIIKNALK